MGRPQQSPEKQSLTFDQKVNVTVNCLDILTKPVEVFLRIPGTAGCRYFANVKSFFGLVAMFFLTTRMGKEEILAPCVTALAMFVVHRVMGSPPGRHSNYGGDSWLEKLPGVSWESARAFWEPFLVLILVFVVRDYSPGIATWLCACSFGLFVGQFFNSLRRQALKRARADALAWQEYVTGQWAEPAPARRTWPRLALLVALGAGGWMLFSGRAELPQSVRNFMRSGVTPQARSGFDQHNYNRGFSNGTQRGYEGDWRGSAQRRGGNLQPRRR